jgi:hypothetical protein
MQPYFVPYLGYFQVMKEVDTFVLTDNYEYSKGGWINRNRVIIQDEVRFLTIPLQAGSDYSTIKEKKISKDFVVQKSLNLVGEGYRKRPYFLEVMPLVESIFRCSERNLFEFLVHSLKEVAGTLEINTNIKLTSQFDLDPCLSGQEKIIKICGELGANQYVNLPGGKAIYDKNIFHEQEIDIQFLKMHDFIYDQGVDFYSPRLSVLDILFNLGISRTSVDFLNQYSIE